MRPSRYGFADDTAVDAFFENRRADAAQAAARAQDAAARAYEKSVEQQHRAIDALEQHNERLAQHNAEIGLTKSQVDAARASQAELTLAHLEAQRAMVGYKDDEDGYNQILDRRIEAQRSLVRLLKDGSEAQARAERGRAEQESARRAEQEWLRTSENIERSLTDSILRGGKSGLEHLKDAFRTAILTPIIQPIVRPIAQFMSGLVSGVTGSIFGGDGGGGGGFGGIGAAIPWQRLADPMLSAIGLGAPVIPGLGGAAGTAAALGELGINTALGAGSGIAAALPWVGGALAVGSMLGMFGDDDNEPPPGMRRDNWLKLTRMPWGAFGVESSEVPDPQAMASLVGALNAALNDPARYDQAKLESMLGTTFSGGPGTGSQALISGLTGQLASADIATANSSRDALRAALLAAQDPAGYWSAEVEKLAGELQTSARSLEEWRAVFLRAIDFGESPEILAKWEALGEAIEKSSNAAGQAAQSSGSAALARLAGMGATGSGLRAWLDAQAVADFLSPEQQLSGARSLFDDALARWAGGDAEAGRSLPGIADKLLGAGRNVYASSAGFQSLRGDVYSSLKGALEGETAAQAAILAELPMSVREGSAEIVQGLDKLRAELKEGLSKLSSDIRMGPDG